MYIIHVTPFSKSIRAQSYTYFSSTKITPGAIVSVPLRSKDIKGLVTGIQDVKELKSQIKSSSFALKKVKGVSRNLLFSKEFLVAANETSNFFATSTGSIINSLLSKNIIDEIDKLQKMPEKETGVEAVKHPKFILQSGDQDRYSEYRSIVREQFAKNKSVLFCVPTIEDAEYAEKTLSRGIENHTFVLNSSKTKKQIVKTWNEVVIRPRPCLVIVTGSFIGIPIKEIGTIIIDRENSGAYKINRRPFFDLRYFIEAYASVLGINLILGDLMLRAETLWRHDQQEFHEYGAIKFRSITDALQKKVDMRNEKILPDSSRSISTVLHGVLTQAIQKNEHTFLLTTRKGMSPLIVCGDCGEIVTCNHCSSPVALHGLTGKISADKIDQREKNFFKCHTCGSQRSAAETCQNCGSWKLIGLGIGTEKIEGEVREIFPDTKVFILDKEHASTPSKARKIVRDFYESACAILIGTEMALLYLREPVENVGVVSIDSLFALPDFRIRERIVNILLRARAIASQKFLIQTRNFDEDIFQNILDGNLTDFYRQEFIDRKKFNYPPFSLIIKISLAAKTTNQLEKHFAALEKILAPVEMTTYPAFVEKVRGQKIMHGMLQIPRDEWPNKEIIEKLRALPQMFKIQIDADSIL